MIRRQIRPGQKRNFPIRQAIPSSGQDVLFANFSVERIAAEVFPALIERDNEIRRSKGLPEKFNKAMTVDI